MIGRRLSASSGGVAPYTWAGRPSAADNQYAVIPILVGGRVTWWTSDGSDWYPVGGFVRLYAKNNDTAHTGTTNKTTRASVTIPAGMLGLNGEIRCPLQLSVTNNANAKNPKIEFGGTEFWGPSMVSTATTQGTVVIANRGSAAVQVGNAQTAGGIGGTSSSTKTTGTVDTTVDQTLEFSFTLANAGDSAQLDRFCVEIHK